LKVVIGSRGSDLALAQTRWIQKRILSLFPDLEVSVRIIKTSGDKDTTSSIRTGSSVGVFVKEIERALLNGEIDLAVHSMKDLPTRVQPGLTIAAIPEREDVRDVLLARDADGLESLRSGARVGTGSLRRQAQLLALRPDLRIADIRGNINTRLKKLDEGAYDAVILACAGLNRLDFRDRIRECFPLEQMLPAPGQGALAVETRDEDPEILPVAGALNHPPTSSAVRAERCFLQRVGGGCNVPVAAFAHMERGWMHIEGLIISPDGRTAIRDTLQDRPEAADEAAVLLADRILERGGRTILDAL
jgi:hydroxymethylbilane synthase